MHFKSPLKTATYITAGMGKPYLAKSEIVTRKHTSTSTKQETLALQRVFTKNKK